MSLEGNLMNVPEIARPKLKRWDLEDLDELYVYHPKHDFCFLYFGCRTERRTVRAMSRILVHQAATIVAQTEGYLSLSREAGPHAQISPDVLIPAGRYYFHATDPALADYSICGHFDAWEPPDGPDALPEPWRTLAQAYNPKLDFVNCDANDFAGWVKRADKCCVLTGNEDLVECQHVVPQEHADWAFRHGMTSRATQSPAMYPFGVRRNIDDVRFLMTMNPFVRDLMDNGLFAPFPLTTADGLMAFVAYFFSPAKTASSHEYHCRTLNMPSRISPYLLYIGFAWTVIKFIVISETGPIARKPLPSWSSTSVHLDLLEYADHSAREEEV
ncbi:hypothetical protein CPB85DRAFT_1305937 [Mucidula mucida]|nr:hypothetical protein CPB85DRAFT_1305937 [Mucidula mucida]